MSICNTLTRVFAIVGLGTLAGIVHSMALRTPVGLGMITPLSTQQPIVDPAQATQPIEQSADSETPEIGNPDAPASDPAEIDPLDIKGPPGTLTLREAKALFDDGAYFIDARHQEEFDESHIAYAVCLPAQKLRTQAGLEELGTIPPDATIVIYCVGGECDASENTAAAIQRLGIGYEDIRILGLGFVDWVAADLPVEHADGTITGEDP